MNPWPFRTGVGTVSNRINAHLYIIRVFRHERGMLRLKRVGCARYAAVYRATNATVRSHSTHSHEHGQNCSHDHGHSHSHSYPHEHHAKHPPSKTSTGPVSTPPPLDPAASTSAAEACQNLVLKRDYKSFLTSKFYPNDVQDGFFALKAFYVYTAPLLLLLRS